jgi:hypothetical protein
VQERRPATTKRTTTTTGKGVVVGSWLGRGALGLGALALASLAITGCGLGDRAARADGIIDSVDLAFAEGTATGTLSTSMRFVHLPDGAGAILGAVPAGADDDSSPVAQLAKAQEAAAERPFEVAVTLDLPGDRASVALGNHLDEPFAVYDGLAAYGRRWSAGPRDARPWVRVDGADINEGDEVDPTQDAPQLFAFAINPVRLVDLLAGPLAGSVRSVGTEQIGDVATTHYRANFDIDKVTKRTRRDRFDEDTRDAFDDLLDVLAVSGRVHPGEVWLDADGRPRQFTLRLKEEPIRHFVIEHTITLRIDAYGVDARPVVPSARERIDVRSVVQYLRSTIPSPRTPEFLTFLGVQPTTTTTAAP